MAVPENLVELLADPKDDEMGYASGFWLAAHKACDANRDRMFDWAEDIVREVVRRVHELELALEDIADASPNWMESDAVAKSERRKSDMARSALEGRS